MEGRVVAAAVSLACVAIAACAPIPSRSSSAPPPVAPVASTVVTSPCECEVTTSELDGLMHYAERVRLLAPGALEREYIEREQGFQEEASAANRIRLAVLLGLRQAPFRDDARARLLLLQAAHQSGYNAEAYRSLAVLLLQQLDERRQMEATLDSERKERQALRRKLEQLKAIEEEIDRRMPPVIQPR